MRAFAVVRCPEGALVELGHGDLIGRLDTAALPLDDGRVSEAHALVSLREGALWLLGLRGAFAIDGQPRRSVELRAGLRVTLAAGVALDVVEVSLPDGVLGVEGPGLPRRVLPGVASLRAGSPPRVVGGWEAEADAHVWTTGGRWTLRLRGSEPRAVAAGAEIPLGDGVLRLVEVPLARAGGAATRLGGVGSPLTVVARYDSVHVSRQGRVVLSLAGILARLVSELVVFDGPVAWTTLVAELWPGVDPAVARSRLDANLTRLRHKLRGAGVRVDLVRTDGAGQIELLRYPGDLVEDHT